MTIVRRQETDLLHFRRVVQDCIQMSYTPSSQYKVQHKYIILLPSLRKKLFLQFRYPYKSLNENTIKCAQECLCHSFLYLCQIYVIVYKDSSKYALSIDYTTYDSKFLQIENVFMQNVKSSKCIYVYWMTDNLMKKKYQLE